MFFAAFFAVYAMSYSSHRSWPPKGIVVPGLALPTVMVALMVLSSVFVQVAVRAVRAGEGRRLTRALAATLGLGLAFAVLQIVAYSQVHFGIRSGTYASLFYLMSAVALAHVAGGVVFLAMVLIRTVGGELAIGRPEPAEAAAIYWHFVVVVSVALYLAFSVLPSALPKGG
jgi:heme/copper-type cytochrome/quinol oxidase subunit 3